MAEGGPGRGRGGRGAIIAKLLEMQRRPGDQPPPPTPPSGDGLPTGVPQQLPASRGPPPTVPQQPQLQDVAPVQVSQPPVQAPPPRSGGRGAIIQRILEAQQQPGSLTATATPPQPEPSVSVQPGPSVSAQLPTQPQTQPTEAPRTMGRGQILQMMAQGRSQAAPTVGHTPLPAPAQTSTPTLSRDEASTAEPSPSARDITCRMRDIEISQPKVDKKGTAGREFSATANYIPLYLHSGRGIYEYEVRFSPLVDDRALIERMLFAQHKELLGGKRRTFDGVTLYLPNKVPEDAKTLISTHPVTNEEHIISLIFRRERSMKECTHMFNVLFNNMQREMNLVRLGREYFSQELAHPIPQHRLEIWPGYVTAVDCFDGGIMLNCNASHKVLRMQTVLEMIDDVIHRSGGLDWKDIVKKQLIGQSVMTRSPVRIYRVDDIDFSQNPTCLFKKGDGTEMSYIEYHKRKNIQIKDPQQPLLTHRPKPSKRQSGTELLMLIPELCYLTGLTDEMRSDFKVMKDVATYTRVNPNQRVMALQKFIDNIRKTPNCVKLLDEWGLKVPQNPIELTARTLAPEVLTFGRGYADKGSGNADWNRAATSQHMLEVVNIFEWLVVYTQRDDRNATGFVEMMRKVCPQMGVRVEYPEMQKIRDDRTESYLRSLRESLSETKQLVVVIFPSQREDRYSAIKKLCCVDRPIPSQVINSRTISKPDKLRSIVQKIALQINCKLGGALWSANIPFSRAMICGIDSYHDSRNKSQSVSGFVASMNKHATRWHSQVIIESSNREFVDGIRMAMCIALDKYCEVNNGAPDTIVVFRDGVGDGQLKSCQEFEIAALKSAFSHLSPDYKPALLFIVCQKRINTRIFMTSPRGNENPPPGSVVDHTVTRRNQYDFFLVSQMVRQGTVTPTHYIVLENTSTLDPDKVQRLTYKMCHLYYNWPGTIRVPAPCQYAHKLAHLVGTSIHKEPAKILNDKLFFL